jgi:hypothetical protein
MNKEFEIKSSFSSRAKVYLEVKSLIETNQKTYNENDKTFYIGYITGLFDFGLIDIKQTRELKLLVKKENK